MTLQAHNWAWQLVIEKPSAKLVLLALVDHANRAGYCHPSQRLIADRTGLTDRTVRSMLAWLEDAGFISRIERRRDDGSRCSDGYQLPEIAYRKIFPGVRKDVPGGAEKSSGLEPPIEPKKEKDSKDTILKEVDQKPDFDLEFEETFWPQYPRDADKKKARAAFKTARRRAELPDIMAGVHRYAADRDGQPDKFTKHAKTWLNGDCWLNKTEAPDTPPPRQKIRTDSIEFMNLMAEMRDAPNTDDETDFWKAIEGTARQNAGSVGHDGSDRAAVLDLPRIS